MMVIWLKGNKLSVVIIISGNKAGLIYLENRSPSTTECDEECADILDTAKEISHKTDPFRLTSR